MQKRVDNAASPSEAANKIWKARRSGIPRQAAFKEISAALNKMAHGRGRCMYCEDNRGTDIDHFQPKAQYPATAFAWSNFFVACSHCNSNQKRTQFPLKSSGEPLLIDPSLEEPRDHFVFIPETGKLIGMTDKGIATENVFGLNRDEILERGRCDAWVTLVTLLRGYRNALARSNQKEARSIAVAVKQMSFSSVFVALLELASVGDESVPSDVVALLSSHPEILGWI